MWWTLKCDKICKNVKSAKNIYKVKKKKNNGNKTMLTRTTLNK